MITEILTVTLLFLIDLIFALIVALGIKEIF